MGSKLPQPAPVYEPPLLRILAGMGYPKALLHSLYRYSDTILWRLCRLHGLSEYTFDCMDRLRLRRPTPPPPPPRN
jgi:hypothetical protein